MPGHGESGCLRRDLVNLLPSTHITLGRKRKVGVASYLVGVASYLVGVVSYSVSYLVDVAVSEKLV